MTKKTRFKLALLSLLIVSGFSFYAVSKDMESLAAQGLAAIMVIVPIFIAGDTFRKSGVEGVVKNKPVEEVAPDVVEDVPTVASKNVKIVGGKRVPA